MKGRYDEPEVGSSAKDGSCKFIEHADSDGVADYLDDDLAGKAADRSQALNLVPPVAGFLTRLPAILD